MAVLARGESELTRLVGAERVRQAKAIHQFPNQKRATARSAWDCYCYPTDDLGIVVAALSEDDVRKAVFQSLEAVEIAESWMTRLNEGEQLWTPPGPSLESPDDWQDELKLFGKMQRLSIDFEGWDRIERVSLANPLNSISLQWSPRVRDWVFEKLEDAGTVLAYNMGFELKLLAQEGYDVEDQIFKWFDVMIACQILYPWRHKGLGKMAPLFVMMEPFKHLFTDDISHYSRIDAAVLLPMWELAMQRIKERGMMKAFNYQLWTACKMWDKPGKLTPTFHGVETPLTKAAGCLEWRNHNVNSFDVERMDLVSLVERVTGADIIEVDLCPRELMLRHLAGFGIRQMRHGLEGQQRQWLGPLSDDLAAEYEDTTRARCKKFDEANPRFVEWRDHLHSSNKRERFVQTWSGRRLVGFTDGEAQLGVLLAEAADEVRRRVHEGTALPGEINGEYFNVASPE